jgi:hypothetical protein
MLEVMTATLAARLETPPTAGDIDRLAMEFLALDSKVDDAYKIATALDEPHEKMKEELIKLVEEFGSAHAEKSKLLHGMEYEILATFGMSTSIDAAAVERFAQALRIAKQTKILNRIFEQTTRYTLRPDAGSIIRAVALPKAQLALYSQCQVTKPRTPTLKVRKVISE